MTSGCRAVYPYMPRLATISARSVKGSSSFPSVRPLLRLKLSPLHLRQLIRETLYFLSYLLHFPAGIYTRILIIVDCIQGFRIGLSLLHYQGILQAAHVSVISSSPKIYFVLLLVQSLLRSFHCLYLNDDPQSVI